MFDTINKIIFTVLGVESLPIDEKKEAIGALAPAIYEESIVRALDQMSEEDEDAFEKLVEENPDPEILFEYLARKVPNLTNIVKKEAEKVKAAGVQEENAANE